MKFNEALRKIREEEGIPQEAVAYMLDVKQQTVSKWELGITEPNRKKIIKLADFFRVPINYFYGRE